MTSEIPLDDEFLIKNTFQSGYEKLLKEKKGLQKNSKTKYGVIIHYFRFFKHFFQKIGAKKSIIVLVVVIVGFIFLGNNYKHTKNVQITNTQFQIQSIPIVSTSSLLSSQTATTTQTNASPTTIKIKRGPTTKIIKSWWWPPKNIRPMGTKVTDIQQLSKGCDHSTDKCWKDAVLSGLVKFIATDARVGSHGKDNRVIVFAIYKNLFSIHGMTGFYDVLPIFLDDGSPAGGEISSGFTDEVDWVYGTSEGAIFHGKLTGKCYKEFFSIKNNIWDIQKISCPE